MVFECCSLNGTLCCPGFLWDHDLKKCKSKEA